MMLKDASEVAILPVSEFSGSSSSTTNTITRRQPGVAGAMEHRAGCARSARRRTLLPG